MDLPSFYHKYSRPRPGALIGEVVKSDSHVRVGGPEERGPDRDRALVQLLRLPNPIPVSIYHTWSVYLFNYLVGLSWSVYLFNLFTPGVSLR